MSESSKAEESDDTIVVMNWASSSLDDRARNGHVHDTNGTCMKRRQGPLCKIEETEVFDEAGDADRLRDHGPQMAGPDGDMPDSDLPGMWSKGDFEGGEEKQRLPREVVDAEWVVSTIQKDGGGWRGADRVASAVNALIETFRAPTPIEEYKPMIVDWDMIMRFKRAWHGTEWGKPGDRTRAGLMAALNQVSTSKAERIERILTAFIGGPLDKIKTMLIRTPPRLKVCGTTYCRIDDPDTGQFLGAYAAEETEETDSSAADFTKEMYERGYGYSKCKVCSALTFFGPGLPLTSHNCDTEKPELKYGDSTGEHDLVKMITAQRVWSLLTFGPGPRTEGLLAHIRKELKEIEDDPDDITEWIDVAILAFDGAWRSGGSDRVPNKGRTPLEVVEALNRKYTKNYNRKWPDWRTVSEGLPIEHLEDDHREFTVDDFDIHEQVSYVPRPGAKPEPGAVARISSSYVFVVFEGNIASVACYPSTLRKMDE